MGRVRKNPPSDYYLAPLTPLPKKKETNGEKEKNSNWLSSKGPKYIMPKRVPLSKEAKKMIDCEAAEADEDDEEEEVERFVPKKRRRLFTASEDEEEAEPAKQPPTKKKRIIETDDEDEEEEKIKRKKKEETRMKLLDKK